MVVLESDFSFLVRFFFFFFAIFHSNGVLIGLVENVYIYPNAQSILGIASVLVQTQGGETGVSPRGFEPSPLTRTPLE